MFKVIKTPGGNFAIFHHSALGKRIWGEVVSSHRSREAAVAAAQKAKA